MVATHHVPLGLHQGETQQGHSNTAFRVREAWLPLVFLVDPSDGAY